ncbi:hypothetical protein LMC13_09895 [Neisseria gonorrhoeae]|nr:hypothetical protein [Neisseria gonorrhoeae]MCC9109876.1 hypothetical protein [Neisseria gonorrhoeae]
MNPARKNLLFSSLLFSSLLFSSAAQAASEGNTLPYVQADLAYAAERITHDYPESTGAKRQNKHGKRLFQKHPYAFHPPQGVGRLRLRRLAHRRGLCPLQEMAQQ